MSVTKANGETGCFIKSDYIKLHIVLETISADEENPSGFSRSDCSQIKTALASYDITLSHYKQVVENLRGGHNIYALQSINLSSRTIKEINSDLLVEFLLKIGLNGQLSFVGSIYDQKMNSYRYYENIVLSENEHGTIDESIRSSLGYFDSMLKKKVELEKFRTEIDETLSDQK